MANNIQWGRTYHYMVQGFQPPRSQEHRMGMWGFTISLDPAFALAAKGMPLDAEYLSLLRTGALRVGEACAGYKGLRESQTVNFWGETMLLTNVSVPGNACGLDADQRDFERLSQEYGPISFDYTPHNVDTMGQAAGLLSIWTSWFQVALARLSALEVE